MQGYLTDSTQSPNDTTEGSRNVRGYLEANGTFQFGPYWTLSGVAARGDRQDLPATLRSQL